jgi:beta-galactosidase
LKFDGDEGTKTELLEFAGSDEYIERTFEINGAKGNNTVGFVFLPGCDFDFKYFKFLK